MQMFHPNAEITVDYREGQKSRKERTNESTGSLFIERDGNRINRNIKIVLVNRN